MTGKIFINYRRSDDAGFTQALYLRLEDEFAAGDLFMDVEGHIKPGDDFVEALNRQVAAADVLLVVIGPRWSELLANRQGDSDDFVAIEIKAGLDQGKRIIPVLVGGATMPRAETLPVAIRPLSRRNAVGLRPERFKADCQGLVAALKESLTAAAQEQVARTETERHAAEEARQQAEERAAARAKAVEQRARVQAAAGLSPEEVLKAEEHANWDFVKERDDVHGLRDHLARFAGGTTERYALAKLDDLVWSALGTSPGFAQLKAYLDEFPKGAHAEAAQAEITKRLEAEAERVAAEHRRSRETAAWGAVAAATDRAIIQAFLSEWPGGQHAAAARHRLKELESKSRLERLASVSPTLACAILGAVGGAFAYGPLSGASISISPSAFLPIFPSIVVGCMVGLAQLVWSGTPVRYAALGGILSTIGWAGVDAIGSLYVVQSPNALLSLTELFIWSAANSIAAFLGMLLFHRSARAIEISLAGVIIGGVAGLAFYRPTTEASADLLSGPAEGAVSLAAIMAVVGMLSAVARPERAGGK